MVGADAPTYPNGYRRVGGVAAEPINLSISAPIRILGSVVTPVTTEYPLPQEWQRYDLSRPGWVRAIAPSSLLSILTICDKDISVDVA